MSAGDGGPAFPGKWVNESDTNCAAPDGTVVGPFGVIEMTGMSLRAYIATQAMLAGEDVEVNPGNIAHDACVMADSLIAELAK